MKKILIWGAGSTGRIFYNSIKESAEVIGFLDNDPLLWGEKIDGIPVLGNASILTSIVYDEIAIATQAGFKIVKDQLMEYGVPAGKIRTDYVETRVNTRITFLHDFAQINKENYEPYAVAEGGVFQGEFAKEINACFPNSTLYLFDTFEGFDERDILIEHKNKYSNQSAKHLSITSEEMVLNKLPYNEKAVLRKGYFPETTQGLEDIKFFFVNLDFDLYNPTLEGLRFFIPRLATGGIILVHDYFDPGYLGVAEAVKDYEKQNNIKLHKFPIGDHCSLGIMI